MSFLNKCRTCGQEIQLETETRASRGYLEGAVVPAYCEWQYNIKQNEKSQQDNRRFLFKRDFNYEIRKDRNGNPEKMPLSTKGKAKIALDNFTRYAEENGCPIPNPFLYKEYKDNWSMDKRFSCYKDFLDFLGLEVDAMPSKETMSVLEVKMEYPKSTGEPVF